MNYRRAISPGGTLFFTVVTFNRKPIFSSPKAVFILKQAFRYTMIKMPFVIDACVIMPDHLHFPIWRKSLELGVP